MIIDGRLVAADTTVRTHARAGLQRDGVPARLAEHARRPVQHLWDAGLEHGDRARSGGPRCEHRAWELRRIPQVASNGTDFYVVWSQFVSDDWAIRGARVTSDGVVSEAGGRALSGTLGTQNWPHVASNGTDYLVTWYMRAADGYYDVYARRISSTGQSLDSADIPIATGKSYDETSAVVASNGTVYLVAWSDQRSGSSRVYATRVSNEGVVLDGTGFPLSSGSPQYMQASASNGQDFLVVWLDSRNPSSWDLYGTRVTGSGSVVDGTGLVVGFSRDLYESDASVASDGSDYFAAWTAWDTSNSTYQNRGSRISASAPSASAVVDTTSLVLSANAAHKHPAVARAELRLLHRLGWQQRRDNRSLYRLGLLVGECQLWQRRPGELRLLPDPDRAGRGLQREQLPGGLDGAGGGHPSDLRHAGVARGGRARCAGPADHLEGGPGAAVASGDLQRDGLLRHVDGLPRYQLGHLRRAGARQGLQLQRPHGSGRVRHLGERGGPEQPGGGLQRGGLLRGLAAGDRAAEGISTARG